MYTFTSAAQLSITHVWYRLSSGGGGGSGIERGECRGVHQVQQAGLCAAEELRHTGGHQWPHGKTPTLHTSLCSSNLCMHLSQDVSLEEHQSLNASRL